MCIFTATLKANILISFGIKYWFVYLLAVIIAAAFVALLLYFRNKENREIQRVRIGILMTLRFLSVFAIAFLLLSPLLKNLKKIIRNPVVIVAWDNSSSLKSTPDSAEVNTEILNSRKTLTDELSKKYTVVEYTFGEHTDNFEKLDFSEKKSDYSELLNSVSNRHFNDNVGSLIIAGDGIYNQGKNPVNLARELNFPVYAIGFGDTTEIMDSRIQNIRVNRNAFAGNKFPVEIDARFLKLKGKSLKLSVNQDKKELASTVVNIPNDNFFVTHSFILDAGNAGLKHYQVSVESFEGELNTKNNTSEFVINVLESKQKILILSDGPHPDIGAVKNTLDLQNSYEVSVFTDEPYPQNLSDFNLLILNQLPTQGKSASEILKKAELGRIPVLFIVGTKTFIPQFNVLTQGVKILPLAGSGEEAQATINQSFATFNLSEDFNEMLPKFPPMQVPFADYELSPGFTPLFYQKIMNIETGKPLLATGVLNGRKTGYLFGEGIWRWRLFDYYLNGNQNLFNELVNQLIQYLSLRQNEDNFIVEFNPVYAEIDDIILTAEVYNDAFERITSEEVNIKIQNSSGEEYEFTFDIQGNKYYLNTGHLPVGDYTFTASVTLGTETFNETGRFTVTPVNFENIVTQANHQILYQLATQTGGKFYLPREIQNLVSDIEQNKQLKSTSYFQEMIQELLQLKILFFVILILLSVEWFLRKYWGIY